MDGLLYELAEGLLWMVTKFWWIILAVLLFIGVALWVSSVQNDDKADCQARGGVSVVNESHKVVCTTGVIK